jgi:hypothetical protein
MVGKRGDEWVNDTVIRTKEDGWTLIHCIENTVFSKLTDGLRSTNSNNITGFTVPIGAIIGGEFTEVQLTSGKVILYV